MVESINDAVNVNKALKHGLSKELKRKEIRKFV